MTHDADEYLTTQEAAALLHCSVSLLSRDRVRRSDLPPFVRIGGRVLYRRSDLDAWMDAQHSNGSTS